MRKSITFPTNRPTLRGLLSTRELLPSKRDFWNDDGNRQSSMVFHEKRISSALTDRLQDIVVFELTSDGDIEYRTMTLRGLYNYVMKVITDRPSINAAIEDEALRSSRMMPSGTKLASELNELRKSTMLSEETGTNRRTSIQSPRTRGGSMDMATDKDQESEDSLSPLPTDLMRRVRFEMQPGDSGERRDATSHLSDSNATVTYRERLGGYLHPRDMRRLVTPFSATNEPQLIVRRHVMLLNFDPLRAIVLRDRLLVLVPDGADSILILLEKQLKGGVKELEKNVFGEAMNSNHSSDSFLDGFGRGDSTPGEAGYATKEMSRGEIAEESDAGNDRMRTGVSEGDEEREQNAETGPSADIVLDHQADRPTLSRSTETAILDFDVEAEEWKEIDDRHYLDMPFELKAVDAVLSCVASLLSDDVGDLRDSTSAAMTALSGESERSTSGDHSQGKLRTIKDGVREMESRVQGFVRALNHVLDEDEDMALMNLSRLVSHPERFVQPVSTQVLEEESDEPELILEAYMQQSLSIVNSLHLLKGQISSTEELIAMHLDAVRNRLLYISTLVSIASLAVGVGSLIGSIFGMNVISTEWTDERPGAFLQITILTVLGAIAMFVVLSLVALRGIEY